MKSSHAERPTARSSGLLTERVGDETVIYDLNTKDVHCLSPLAVAVFEACDGRSTYAEIAKLAEERLGQSVTPEQVAAAVAQLEERSLLDTPPVVLQDGHTRRQFAHKSAMVGAAAFAAPIIASIAAPTAAMALSQIPPGCTGCGHNHDCTSNHCCQDVAGKQCNQTCCVLDNNSCHIDNSGNCTVQLQTCPTCPPGSSSCCVPI